VTINKAKIYAWTGEQDFAKIRASQSATFANVNMTGDVTVGGAMNVGGNVAFSGATTFNVIPTTGGTPANAYDLTTKAYVDSQISNNVAAAVLDTLNDVTVTNTVEGDILIYNQATHQWENKVMSGDFTIQANGLGVIANNAVTAAKTNFIGSATATAGNVFVAAGTNFKSKALTGDVTIDSLGVTRVNSISGSGNSTSAGSLLIGNGTSFKSKIMSGNVTIDSNGLATVNGAAANFTVGNALTVNGAMNVSGNAAFSQDTTFTNLPTSGATPTTAYQLTTKAYVDSQLVSGLAGKDTLSKLNDVTLTNTANLEFLVYDSASSKWINKSFSGDVTIDSGTVTINKAKIYAWTGEQDFAKIRASQNATFANVNMTGDVTVGGALNVGGAVSMAGATTFNVIPTTGGSPANAYDLTTKAYVDTQIANNVSAAVLDTLNDVTVTNTVEGNILIYNQATHQWENKVMSGDFTIQANGLGVISANSVTAAKTNFIGNSTATAGNVFVADGTNFKSKALTGDVTIDSLGVTKLNIAASSAMYQLNDVTLSSTTNADMLVYDSTASKWKNKAITGDVTIDILGVTKVNSFSGTSTNAANVAITNDVSSNATMNLVWSAGTGGNQALKVSSTGLIYNPSLGNVGIGNSTLSTARLHVSGKGTTTGQAFAVADSTLSDNFVVLDNGNVGIGMTAPSASLQIASGNSYNIWSGPTGFTDLGQWITNDGVSKNVFTADATATNYVTSILGWTRVTANNPVLQTGIVGTVTIENPSGTTSGGTGVQGEVDVNAAGNQDYAIAFQGYVNKQGAGTLDYSIGFYSATHVKTGGTTNVAFGLYAADQNVGTSNYNVYINQWTVGANNYALYSAGKAKSYFAGNVGIGTTTPSQILEVAGSGKFSGSVQLGGDLTMATNTAGNLLVANGSSYTPKAITGDVTIDSLGVTKLNVAASSAMYQLNDVTLSSTANADMLLYDSSVSKWKNKAISGDVTIDNTGRATVVSSAQFKSYTIEAPSDTDNIMWFKAPYALTITNANCIVDPGDAGESAVIDIQRRDSSGLTPTSIDAAITCTNGGAADDGALSAPNIAAGDWVSIDVGTVTGTVTQASVTITFVKTAE
ncbi:MAG: hypothetical protein HQL26_11075, partial [Candidatus Omnitrophica bacterium]|nr:hypothetical protein [Candidatus Omnitrophota bacterium]